MKDFKLDFIYSFSVPLDSPSLEKRNVVHAESFGYNNCVKHSQNSVSVAFFFPQAERPYEVVLSRDKIVQLGSLLNKLRFA